MQSWQTTWGDSSDNRSLLTPWFGCKVSVGWIAVCLQIYIVPLMCLSLDNTVWRLCYCVSSLSYPCTNVTILAISSVWFFFFFNHKGVSLIVVLIMELSWSIMKIYTFCFYICDWLKYLQDLTNIYVFKYRLLISLHICNWSQTISHKLNSSIKQGKKKRFHL